MDGGLLLSLAYGIESWSSGCGILKSSVMVNFILYQTAWFALVFGVAYDRVIAGMVYAVLTIMIHFIISKTKSDDLLVFAFTTVVGTLAETMFQWLDVFEIVRGDWWPPLAAPWLIVMWASFSTTLCRSMEWVFKSLKLAMGLGFIFGPIAYWGGSRMGAIKIAMTLSNALVLAIVWGVVMLVLALWVQKIDPLKSFSESEMT